MNKSDPLNNSAFSPCLLRVPFTFNSKCLEEGVDSEVKIIYLYDNSQEKPPEIDNLLIEFQTFLVDRKLKAEINNQKKTKRNDAESSHNAINTIPYVEKLLGIQIEDHRKFAISLILAPYFILIKI